AAIAINRESARNIVILRLAKRAEGPLKCNARFLPRSRRNLQVRGSSPSPRPGMTRFIGAIRRMHRLRPQRSRARWQDGSGAEKVETSRLAWRAGCEGSLFRRRVTSLRSADLKIEDDSDNPTELWIDQECARLATLSHGQKNVE